MLETVEQRTGNSYRRFQRDIQFGRDGSIIRDNMWIFVLPGQEPAKGRQPIRKIDYFYSIKNGNPIAQMAGDKISLGADEMINLCKGRTAYAIRTLQRRWRIVQGRKESSSPGKDEHTQGDEERRNGELRFDAGTATFEYDVARLSLDI